MSETFFESPLYVYFALALGELVLGVLWHERRTRKFALAMIAPPVLAVLVGLVAWLVVTDREQIESAARDIANAIEQNQTQRIPAHLDADFTASVGGMPIRKEGVVMVCNSNIERWGIDRVTFHKVDVQVDGSRARMHLTTFLTYDGGQRSGLIWDLEWINRGGEWLILKVAEPKQGFEL